MAKLLFAVNWIQIEEEEEGVAPISRRSRNPLPEELLLPQELIEEFITKLNNDEPYLEMAGILLGHPSNGIITKLYVPEQHRTTLFNYSSHYNCVKRIRDEELNAIKGSCTRIYKICQKIMSRARTLTFDQRFLLTIFFIIFRTYGNYLFSFKKMTDLKDTGDYDSHLHEAAEASKSIRMHPVFSVYLVTDRYRNRTEHS
ncbi:hypothetical protein GEMRC1_012508 [Eukaryota sp. GEM-RC1]